MSDTLQTKDTPASSKGFKFPTAYTILFALIALVALGTWFVPAGQYERVENTELGREVPVPEHTKLSTRTRKDLSIFFSLRLAGSIIQIAMKRRRSMSRFSLSSLVVFSAS